MTFAQVSGKERIRGPNLAVLVKRLNGVPMEEALRKADEAGLVIASNKRLNEALVGDEWNNILDVFACWTGTMTAYDKPGKKLGKTIEYVDPKAKIRYVFPVPEEHIGKKNVILVAEHPNFDLKADGKNRIVQATEIGIVESFPAANGCYLEDSKYGIPTGNGVNYANPDARSLGRIGKRVGLVCRGEDDGHYGDWGDDPRNIALFDVPSYAFGVAIEAASGSGEKKSKV